ncbi:MAG: outer membrane protein assembly factor BamA [Deltaproteobacteria bacterium]|nr:outer membrane protein assembly factor BamA [Deltaproteobacteria bacterium]
MKRSNSFFALILVCQLVSEIEVVGLKALKREDIESFLPKTAVEENIKESLKLLAKTGWFQKIEYFRDTSTNKFVLVLKEKPLVKEITIETDKFRNELQEELSSFRLSPLDQEEIEKKVKTFMDKKGFSQAELKQEWNEDTGALKIKVSEGNRIKVTDIELDFVDQTGRYLTDVRTMRKEILKKLSTSKYRWWLSWLTGKGYLSETFLAQDKNLIEEYCKLKGFLTCSAEVNRKQGRQNVKISFEVRLGDRFIVKSVNSSKELDLKDIRVNEFFDGFHVRKVLERELKKFKDRGYAFANLVPSFKEIKETKEIEIYVNVDEGLPQSIGTVRITGNKKTRDYVIRRDILISEGDVFNLSKIERSKRRLLRTGYFSDVKHEVFRSENKSNHVDIVFDVKEAQTGSLSLGAGYSTLDNAFVNFRMSERNVFGTGIGVYLSAYLGSEFNSFNARFNEPRIFNSFYSVSSDIFRNRRDYDDFKRYQTGTKVSVGYDFEEYEFLKDISLKGFLDIRKVEISDVLDSSASFIKDSRGDGVSVSVGTDIKRSDIDKIIRPSKGSVQSLLLEYGGFGGDFEFLTFGISNSVYWPVLKLDESNQLILSIRTDLDYGKGLGGKKYPLFRRFFPGGPKSVRGYKPRSMGPREGSSEYGGSKQLINNLELIYPLSEEVGLDLVCFFDIGEAFDDGQSINLDELRKAYGAGFRWASPLGPLSLDFGFPLDKREGDKNFVVNFSVGTDF